MDPLTEERFKAISGGFYSNPIKTFNQDEYTIKQTFKKAANDKRANEIIFNQMPAQRYKQAAPRFNTPKPMPMGFGISQYDQNNFVVNNYSFIP